MDIDSEAPVIARAQVQIAADPETVWDVLSDFEQWPSWNSDVRSMSLRGPLEPGSTFEWKAGPGKIRSRLGEVDHPHKIAWTGVTLSIKAVDVFRIEARDSGTVVTEEESWSGLMARLFRSPLQRTLQKSIEQGLQSLKAAAETRALAAVGQRDDVVTPPVDVAA